VSPHVLDGARYGVDVFGDYSIRSHLGLALMFYWLVTFADMLG
jgi:hypothetical protein